MQDQTILNIIMGTALAVIGWFARQLWDAVQTLKIDVQKIEVDLPSNYIRKDEFQTRMDKVESMLEKIFDKLDHKADK